jgi:hypothetical protein
MWCNQPPAILRVFCHSAFVIFLCVLLCRLSHPGSAQHGWRNLFTHLLEKMLQDVAAALSLGGVRLDKTATAQDKADATLQGQL